jgi:hypothetical protein
MEEQRKQLTALMQEQATLAAQAVVLGQGGAKEQIQLQRANLLMLIALNIPEYEGEAAVLPDFLDRGAALVDQLNATPGDEATDRAIMQLLVGRVATHVRRQIGVTANMDWEEVARRLKEQYGGARKPFQKQAVSLISMGRQRGESPSQFARRMEEGARALKARVYETTKSSEEAHATMQILDLLISERLRREMPERVKKTLKCVSDSAQMKDLVDIIRDEDEEFGEAMEKEERWSRAEPRRVRDPRGVGGRERRRRYSPPPVRAPRREERTERGQRRPPPRSDPKEDRRCYQCGTRGHLARVCPYIARRGDNVFRPEPMEVNAALVEGRRRRPGWTRRSPGPSEESAAEDSSRSPTGSSGSESERPATRTPRTTRSYAEVSKEKGAQK